MPPLERFFDRNEPRHSAIISRSRPVLHQIRPQDAGPVESNSPGANGLLSSAWYRSELCFAIIHPVLASRLNTLITMMKSANFCDCYDRPFFHALLNVGFCRPYN